MRPHEAKTLAEARERGLVHRRLSRNSQGCAPGTSQVVVGRITPVELQEAEREAGVRLEAIHAWCDHELAGECPKAVALEAIEGLASTARAMRKGAA